MRTRECGQGTPAEAAERRGRGGRNEPPEGHECAQEFVREIAGHAFALGAFWLHRLLVSTAQSRQEEERVHYKGKSHWFLVWFPLELS